ncbi:MAG: BamA/TamA family outer membrane protein [Bacteroidota bacterium]|nr:BamA/TamA family outer membrane protein [Bacteroidota bacterium]
MRFLTFLVVFQFSSAYVSAQTVTTSDSSQEKNGAVFFPVMYYTPETRIAVGAASLYFHQSLEQSNTSRPTAVTTDIIYTQNKQITFEVSSDAFFTNGKYWHTGSFFYQKFPNQFYGIGNSTPDSAKENFTIEAVRINPTLLFRTSPHLFIGPQIHYEHWSFVDREPGKLLEQQTIQGSTSTTVSGIGTVVNYDERDNIFAPHTGRFYQANFITSPKFLGSTSDFSRLKIDLREYFNFSSSHVLAAQVVFHSSSGAVPFRFLPQLGGKNILRGYFEGRYRDKNLLVAQSEYRSPFWWRFGFVVFGGVGDVASTIDKFNIRDLKISYGAGLRLAFIPEEFIIIRLDYGIGQNSNGFYATINEAI